MSRLLEAIGRRFSPDKPTQPQELFFTHLGGELLVTRTVLEDPRFTESLLTSLVPNILLEPDHIRGIYITGPLIRTWVINDPKSLAEIIRMPDRILLFTPRLSESGIRCFRTATRELTQRFINAA